MKYEEFLTHFEVITQKGNSAQCICPAHKDKNPSLTITNSSNGILLHCHAGCNTLDVLKAAGLNWSDLYENGKKPKTYSNKKTLVEFASYNGSTLKDYYDYYNLGGYCYTRVRLEPKSFRYCIKENGDSYYVDQFKLQDGYRESTNALFPSPYVIDDARKENKIIYVLEGEKDAKTAKACNLKAVTFGSSHDWYDTLNVYFKESNVVIIPDNDKAGFECSKTVANSILKTAASVKILQWDDDFINKGDFTDFIMQYPNTSEGIAAFNKLKLISIDEFIKKHLDNQDNSVDLPDNSDESVNIAKKIYEIKNGKVFRLSDQDGSALLSEVFPQCRYNQTAKDWNYYDGCKWILDAGGLIISHYAKLFVDACIIYAGMIDAPSEDKHNFSMAANRLLGHNARKRLIDDARDCNYIKSEILDTDSNLLNCLNGTLNLSTGELLQHDPSMLISKSVNAEYDPYAQSSDFIKFYDEIMQHDTEKMNYLQKALGYSLLGDPVLETFFICYGPTTRNGKSTLLETILYILGDYGTNVEWETFAKIKRDSRAASGDIARLKGIRFVNVSEPEQNMKLNEALVKKTVARGIHTARNLFERDTTFRDSATYFWDCNYLPQIYDRTIFLSGRVYVIPFSRHFSIEERDLTLKNKLETPYNCSGILNWLLEGLKKYNDEGLEVPDSVRLATLQYDADSDRLKQFIDECLIEDITESSKGADVYCVYQIWCRDSGIQAQGKQNFFKAMRDRNMMTFSATINGQTLHNIISGYRISPDYKPI